MKELRIEALAYGGDGIARVDGQVVFVPGVLPGETVVASEEVVKPSYRRARLVQVLQAAPDRIEPACPMALRAMRRCAATSPFCTGCVYQHMSYSAELAVKSRQASDLLDRLSGVRSVRWAEPVAAPAPLGYRNKLVLHTAMDRNQVQLGHVQADNRTVLDLPACALAVPPLNDQLKALRAKAGFFKTLRDGMDLTFRHTLQDGPIWWRGKADPTAPWLTESTGIGPLRVPRGSFFQINPAVADRLGAHMAGILRASRCSVVFDLYCGAGVFALYAALAGKAAVVGIEADAMAMRAAEYNGRTVVPAAGKRLQWLCGDVVTQLPKAMRGVRMQDLLVIVDPPRAGLAARLLDQIVSARPAELLYIACAPDTQARDLIRLREAGYVVQTAGLFDMFPRTAHFEVVLHAMRTGD